MQQVERTVGLNLEPVKIAIVAGILLADELKKERSYVEQLDSDEQENYQVIALTKKLIEKLDKIDGVVKDDNLG